MADCILDTQGVTQQIKAELTKTRHVRVAVPFVTKAGIELLSEKMRQHPRKTFHVQLLTRFDMESILSGVCDLEALQMLFNCGNMFVTVEIKRLNNLHAKYFIFDQRSVIIGSSNMTEAGQTTNVELGFSTAGHTAVKSSIDEFDKCWQAASFVDCDWISEQKQLLEPFQERYQRLRSEMRNLTVLQSIKMPSCEQDFLKSVRLILKKASTSPGMTKTWLEQEMLKARASDPAEDEPKLNVDKRIAFLKVLGLVQDQEGPLRLTPLGKECRTSDKRLFQRMLATFPILTKSYEALPEAGSCTRILLMLMLTQESRTRPAKRFETQSIGLRLSGYWSNKPT